MQDALLAAQALVEHGWKVFPLHTIDSKGQCTCGVSGCADAGKHPRPPRGGKDASNDPEQIKKWFGPSGPPSNIGLPTGQVNGITVLDIDTAQGKKGAATWAALIQEQGEPVTLMAKTGSGGMHVVFQYYSGLKTSSNTLGEGIDCRNDGGYIVVAPSKHRSGGVYEWINWGEKIAPLPAHLSRRKETRGRKRKEEADINKCSLERLEEMLAVIPADDRDDWRHFGIIIGRTFDRSDDAWQIYCRWSEKYKGKKGRNHDEIMREAFHELSQQSAEQELSLGTIIKAAIAHGWAPKNGDVPIKDFLFFGPGNNYIYRPMCNYWIAPAVDSAVSPVNVDGKIVKASDWLRHNALATSMTRDPAIHEDYVKGFNCLDGQIVAVPGAALFNSYRKPNIEPGDAKLAQPFLKHITKLLPGPGDKDQFLAYMAHRVQRPEEKPRFALLIAGGQGVGKDTAIEFCCPAIGVWNVANIEPQAFDSAFNEYASATLVRISEAANLHEMTKWAFNERTKVLIAGSPDVVQINPKYGQKFSVRMHCGVIITTNHLASGIYIPEDDRRYDVMECATLADMGLFKDNVRKEYFTDLWHWFNNEGGMNHVAAYLADYDISKFSASNGQRKTDAHRTVVAAGMSGDQWLDDILDEMKNPDAIRADWILAKAVAQGEKEMEVRRKLSNSIGRVGYVLARCPTAKDGRWKLNGKKYTVYVKAGTPSDQIETLIKAMETGGTKEPF